MVLRYCAIGCVLISVSCTLLHADTRRNFLFLLVDDLGWADVGCNGSTFHETPHIDALAKSGMRFTNAYAACPVCSPTRASIMTGRHPVRVDITDWIPGMNADRVKGSRFQQVQDRDSLALEELTIAEALGEVQYQTFFAGKWHLGGEGFLPTDQGFEINKGGHDRGSPPGGYYSPFKNPYLKNRGQREYLTERLTDESIDFLKSRNQDRPFFLYLSYYNVHTPIQAYEKRIEYYREKRKRMFGSSDANPIEEKTGVSRARQDYPEFASMVAAVDDSVGRLMQSLEELNLDKNTTVIFFSDNGGLCTKPKPGPTSNLPLRSGKGWCYEGGIREPMIVRSPGVTKPGTQCDVPVISMDFFPTILELAGMSRRPDAHADGVSLVPLLEGQKEIEHEPLVWHYPHYHGSTWRPGAAIRDGRWKLIEFYEYDEVELYDLQNDIGEQDDLSEKMPKKVAELRQRLSEWQTRMNAKMPEPR